MSILAYNGGIVIAMKGDGCVAIATDRRLGVEGRTVSIDFERVFEMGPRLFVGLPGLATDTITVSQKLRFDMNLYELQENRQMTPKTFATLLSGTLYEKRFGPYFIEPVVAGMDPKTNEPYVACMDLIGSTTETVDFVVSGTAEEEAYGMCETLWRPGMKPDELFECISQCVLNAMDRDAISGWGVKVHVMEKDKVTTRYLKTRMD
ncbi:proteasome subunit beta type-3 [Galendromus occidentalis]|uniref:Proteasome subunit beta n=1 Tax=Galendromus occidentalis TaxID=34638 RepID=A0AAJ6VYR7_9ACAR|nr:proteasome subunit beta type-3 [Galendromus occidentalis]